MDSLIGAPIERLDVETVVKASQALSGEMRSPELIRKLVRLAVEHAGAARGLIVLQRGDELKVQAVATAGRAGIEVAVRAREVTPADLPLSILGDVVRTRKSVILGDATAAAAYSNDEYLRRTGVRSVLCLPILNQANLLGVLYVENDMAPHAFTSDRVAVLEMLASQAAISLENARLYLELQRGKPRSPASGGSAASKRGLPARGAGAGWDGQFCARSRF
ncbi:MAG: GAF domain-containing protein [Caulobacteraceae bacterium]